MANTHQGQFPVKDTGEDGHIGIARSLCFLRTVTACMTWLETSGVDVRLYRPDYYARLVAIGGIANNPTGPTASYDPGEPAEKKKVQRGGSFLCTDQYCSRYLVGSRGKGELSTGTNHLGFRCVRSPQTKSQPAGS